MIILSILITICVILETIFKIASSLAVPCFIVFLILKLCNVIAWSWWLVVTPLFVLVGSILCVVIFSVIVSAVE